MAKTQSVELPDRIVAVWKRHNDILLLLLRAISQDGLAALPTASRGRDVARVFFHLDRVRRAWLQFFATGKRPSLPRADKGPPPKKAALLAALRESGRDVEELLAKGARRRRARADVWRRSCPLAWISHRARIASPRTDCDCAETVGGAASGKDRAERAMGDLDLRQVKTGLGGYFVLQQGMDISRTGVAYVVLDNDNILYSVNLATGQASSLGKFPTGSVITDLTAPTTGPLRRRTVLR